MGTTAVNADGSAGKARWFVARLPLRTAVKGLTVAILIGAIATVLYFAW